MRKRKKSGSGKTRPNKAGTGDFAKLFGLMILVLLTVAMACMGVVAVNINGQSLLPWNQFVPLATYAISLPVTWIWLRLINYRGDAALIVSTFMLIGLGMVIQFRMGSYADGSWTSSIWLAYPLGWTAFILCITCLAKGRIQSLNVLGIVAYILAVGLLCAMVFMGQRFRGGTYLAGYINPSEIVKPLLVIFLASFLSKRENDFDAGIAWLPTPAPHSTLWLLLLWSVPTALVLLLRDLGLIVLLNICLVVMLYVSSKRAGYLAIGFAGVIILGFLLNRFVPHVQARFDVWLHPFSDPTGKSWQVLQALSAMYSGGMWGSGIGYGVPHAVPIVTSDFIYAALAEEIGLIGCAMLLLIYGLLFSRGWRAAAAATSPFSVLLSSGLTASIAFQTVLNLGGVTKFLPLTGITLPLISHGGSSLISVMIIIGLIAAISDRKP